MTAATSHSEVSIPLKDKRIRIQNKYTKIPHALLRMAIKELHGPPLSVFFYIWERTISFQELTCEIKIQEIVNATDYSERSIQTATSWMEEHGWLTISHKDGHPNEYGIDERILRSSGIILEEQVELTPAESAPPSSFKRFKEKKKEKEIPKPTDPVSTTGPSNEVAILEGSGSFVVEKAEELQIVKTIVGFGVNKQRVLKSLFDKKEKWVTEIYEEFLDNFYNGKHEMKNPAAVLWKRLGDYEETWRKEAVKAVGAGKTPDHQKLPEELVAKYQQAIDEMSPDENDPKMAYLEYVSGLQAEVEREIGKRLDFEIVRAYLHMPGMAVNMVKKALAGEVAL